MTGPGSSPSTGPDRKVYVWRLVVTLPEGSDIPGWKPEEWDGYPHGVDPEHAKFTWPRRRLYFSADAANRRASLLRRFGAEVSVERSEAVTW